MERITIKKTQYVTDIYTTEIEVSTTEFPELLSEDFSFEGMSEELKYHLEAEDGDEFGMDNKIEYHYQKL